eukprot:3221413-Pyramimonas_sp.AAC.1
MCIRDRLRGEDVHVSVKTFSNNLPSDDTQHAIGGIKVALLLGRRHRGESVKTGQEQGVAIDSGLLSHILAER